jgi:two-component system alkaline phosphatase synthesis response regulator PhoP
MNNTTILVVEDDRILADTLVYNLRQEGYATATARTGPEAIVAARTQKPDLILLDLMLPEINGFDVCRSVRTTSTVPIIMLTARTEEADRVLGLELGADDYVVKPFSLRELLARVRAQIRRNELASTPEPAPETLRYEDLEIRLGPRSAIRNQHALVMLPREFDLLTYLVRNRGIVLTREQLLDKVWGEDFTGGNRTVDVHVRRLRVKIEDDPTDPRLIRTVRSVGYIFGTGQR